MQLTNTVVNAQPNGYTRDQLIAMRMRRGAISVEIPTNVINRINNHVVQEEPVARRLNFDNIQVERSEPQPLHRTITELPPIFISDGADINDNEVRFGGLDWQPLEEEEPQR
jgi:hypothetical protein